MSATRQRVARRGSPVGPAAIVVQAVLAAACLALVVTGQGLPLPFVSDRFELEVTVADAAGLKTEDRPPVTVAGVIAGRVSDVRLEDGRAVVALELEDEVEGRIHDDATAEIVPRSALNDLTIDLDPGTSERPALPEGARIDARDGVAPVGLDRLVGVLDADTRAHLQVLLAELDLGLRGRAGPLRAALRELGPLVDSGGRMADALADRRRLLARLVEDLEVVFATLGRRGDQLRQALNAGRVTFETAAGRSGELAAAMRELPSTLAQLERGLRGVADLAPVLNPALERLRTLAPPLPSALRELRAFTPVARDLVGELGDLTVHGREPARQLRGALVELGPAARALRAPVAKLLPITRAIDQHREGIGELGANFSGIFSTNDANGPLLRGLGVFEPVDPANFGQPGARGRRLAELNQDVARALTRVCLRENDVACLVRYLVPGLPGAVRETAE